jgi:hypothetical protein
MSFGTLLGTRNPEVGTNFGTDFLPFTIYLLPTQKPNTEHPRIRRATRILHSAAASAKIEPDHAIGCRYLVETRIS